MLINLLNSCLQSFYKIANINISIWIILLIPVVLVIFQYLYAVHIETKYKNDTYISEDGTEPNKLNRYSGIIHDRNSIYFKRNYIYWTNEIFVTIAAGIFILLNMELDSNWSITSWQDSKYQIIYTTIIMLIVTKIIIQGFVVSDLLNTIFLISQLLISILLTKRLPLFIFWYTYPVGLIGSFVMFRRYKKLKKNPYEKIDQNQYEMYNYQQAILEAEAKMRQEEMQRSSYRYSSNYSRQHKSEKESLYEMKHPSASSTQMTNMLKFGENRPNG